MAPIANVSFPRAAYHTVKSARLQAEEITRQEKSLWANKGTFLAIRDPRLYSRKLKYCRAAVRKTVVDDWRERSQKAKVSAKAHFVRNYVLLANYLHRSH